MAIVNDVDVGSDADLLTIPEGDKLTVPPQVGLAAIALNFAMKYVDIITVQDGALYQQYKLEGRNMQVLHLKEVFYYAEQIEKHLLDTPSRLANLVLEAVCDDISNAIDEESASGTEAGTGETEGLDPKDDGPTAESGDAQT